MAKFGMEPNRERLVALVLLLQRAWSHAPLTQEEIIRELKITKSISGKASSREAAYQGDSDAVRQKFERDKDKIRQLGFQIETVDMGNGQTGYRIDPSSAYAPAIAFSEEEERIVRLALRFCGFDKSGVFSVFNEVPATAGGVEASRFLTPVIRATIERRALTFDYQSKVNKTRTVEPLKIGVFNDVTYLIARTLGTSEIKGYRMIRITSMPVVLPDRFVIDEATEDAANRWIPEFSKEPKSIDLVFETSENFADLLLQQYPDAVVASKKGGKVEVGLSFDSPRIAMRFVLEAADRIRLTSPKSLREDLVTWLKSVNRGKAPNVESMNFKAGATNDVLGQTLQLMHAVYNATDGLRVSELAQRFSMDPKQVRDIMDSLSTLQPMLEALMNPEEYPAHIFKDFESDDDIEDPRYLVDWDSLGSRDPDPSPLMWRDLIEINIALREASRIYAEPAVFSAIEKIEDVMKSFVRFESSVNEALLRDVQAAAQNHLQIKIQYIRGVGEEATIRSIEPREVKILNGRTYVRAFCTTRQEWRTFRVDRIAAILATSDATEQRVADASPNWLTQVGEEGDEVVVVVDAGLRWIFEPLPNAQWLALEDGRHAVRFRVVEPAFLDHLMLRAGEGAVVATEKYARAGHALAKKIAESL